MRSKRPRFFDFMAAISFLLFTACIFSLLDNSKRRGLSRLQKESGPPLHKQASPPAATAYKGSKMGATSSEEGLNSKWGKRYRPLLHTKFSPCITCHFCTLAIRDSVTTFATRCYTHLLALHSSSLHTINHPSIATPLPAF